MYFTVKKHLRIAGKCYKPCICYELPDSLVTTIRQLETKGDASITEVPVFFQNGKKLPTEAEKAEEIKALKKAERKAKKDKKEAESEEVLEGF